MKSLSLALLIAASAAIAFAPRPAPALRTAEIGCKPLAPLALTLEEVVGVNGRSELAFTITPVRELKSLEWELLLTDGLTHIDGELSGRSGAEAGALVEAALRSPAELAVAAETTVVVPNNGLHQIAELVVTGIMQGSDETGATFDEPITATATIEWDRPASPVAEVLGYDADADNGLAPVAVVPSTYEPGR